mgnify:CR=1 FL=1
MAISKKKISIDARQRTKFRIRRRVSGTEESPRVTVFRSSKHLYGQLVVDTTGETVVSASTLDKEVADLIKTLPAEGENKTSKSSKSTLGAKAVGLILAKRSKEKSISKVVFDRNGFQYRGRVKAFADGAREGGLQF